MSPFITTPQKQTRPDHRLQLARAFITFKTNNGSQHFLLAFQEHRRQVRVWYFEGEMEQDRENVSDQHEAAADDGLWEEQFWFYFI